MEGRGRRWRGGEGGGGEGGGEGRGWRGGEVGGGEGKEMEERGEGFAILHFKCHAMVSNVCISPRTTFGTRVPTVS